MVSIFPAQAGHHDPRLTCLGTARHSWPARHLHRRWVELSTYLLERHWPPRFSAMARISSIDGMPSRQRRHHDPPRIVFGVAVKTWPFAQLHVSLPSVPR